MIPTKRGQIKVRRHTRTDSDRKGWVVDIPPGASETGKRARRFFDSKSEADQFKSDYISMMRRRALLSDGTVAHLTLHETVGLWNKHHLHRVQRGLKQVNSHQKDLHYLKALLPFFGEWDIAQITDEQVGDYQIKRLTAGRAATTINAEVNLLKSILRFAEERNWLGKAPKFENLKVDRKRIELPTPEEVSRILAHLDFRTASLVRLLAETGCRKQEAFRLRWDEVDLGEPCLHIYADRSRDRAVKTFGSGRSIPISDGLAAQLSALPRTNEWVFPGRSTDGPVTDIDKALRRAIKEAKVERNGKPLHVPVKNFRKFYVSIQKSRGVDLFAVQTMVGHTPGSKTTEQHYLHIPGTMVRDAVLDVDCEDVARTLATRATDNPKNSQ